MTGGKKNKNLKDLYDIAMSDDVESFSPLFDTLLQIGDRYSDCQLLATGGMKRIFKVKDLTSERFVALAKLHENAPQEHYDSFIREARLTGKLEHPNIMTVHDIGVNTDNEPFFTMELKSGGTLEDILRERNEGNEAFCRKYTLEKLLGIFIKVCDAVSYAHSKNVIHLDLKPANIQVGDFGEVLVCDWGLGKVIGDEDNAEMDQLLFNPDLLNNMTLSGHIKGTPGFMAPEQIDGKADKNVQTDIYALGCILYALLTDSNPVEGSTEEKLAAVAQGKVQSPIERFPVKNIPQSLNAVVVKAMAFEPSKRYLSSADLREEVYQYISGYATSAEGAGFAKQCQLFWQRNSLVCKLTLCFLAVILLSITAFVVQLQSSRDEAESQKGKALANEKKSREALLLYLSEKKQLENAQKKWSTDITVNTEPLRYHFFYDSPNRYIRQTLEGLNKAIDIDPENKRALGLIGHQYFMMQKFNRANEAFAQSYFRQEDLYPISKKFAQLKGDNELLTVEQLIELIKEVGNDFKRRHHLCERLLAWDVSARRKKVDYSQVVKELLVINNGGRRDFKFEYSQSSKKLVINGNSIKALAEDNSIGSGRCLLRFIELRHLVLNIKSVNLRELDGLSVLESLDLRHSEIKNYGPLSMLPKLKKVILSAKQFAKYKKSSLPGNISIEVR